MDFYHSGLMSQTDYGYVCSLEEMIDRKIDKELEKQKEIKDRKKHEQSNEEKRNMEVI